MATRNTVEVDVCSRDNRELPHTKGTITQVTWDKPERVKNALRTLGMMLVATFVAIFIPILHWVLVPALLVGSFVVALDKLNEGVRSEGGSVECTKCHQTCAISASKWTPRITQNCQSCGEDLELSI